MYPLYPLPALSLYNGVTWTVGSCLRGRNGPQPLVFDTFVQNSGARGTPTGPCEHYKTLIYAGTSTLVACRPTDHGLNHPQVCPSFLADFETQ